MTRNFLQSTALIASASLLGCLSASALISVEDLGWLSLTESTDWSFEAIQSEFTPGGAFDGYRHATLIEVQSLTTAFGYDASATPEANADAVVDLQAFLGTTYATSAFQFQAGTLGYTEDGTRFDITFIAPDIDNTATYEGYANTTEFDFPSLATPQIGHYLVQAVPEPALTVAALGLLAFAAASFKRFRKAP